MCWCLTIFQRKGWGIIVELDILRSFACAGCVQFRECDSNRCRDFRMLFSHVFGLAGGGGCVFSPDDGVLSIRFSYPAPTQYLVSMKTGCHTFFKKLLTRYVLILWRLSLNCLLVFDIKTKFGITIVSSPKISLIFASKKMHQWITTNKSTKRRIPFNHILFNFTCE